MLGPVKTHPSSNPWDLQMENHLEVADMVKLKMLRSNCLRLCRKLLTLVPGVLTEDIKEGGNLRNRTDTGVMQPQGTGYLGPAETGRGKRGILL